MNDADGTIVSARTHAHKHTNLHSPVVKYYSSNVYVVHERERQRERDRYRERERETERETEKELKTGSGGGKLFGLVGYRNHKAFFTSYQHYLFSFRCKNN